MQLKRVRLLLFASVLCSSAHSAITADSAAEEAAIRQLEMQQAETWNRHDAKAYGALFAQDGDCVNVLGWWWKGRSEIEAKLTDAFAFVFAQSALKIEDITIRFLQPDCAVVHTRWTMTGARAPQGSAPPPQQGIQTQVVQKKDGKWLIAAFQNTNSIPEMPFPKAPPAAQPSPSNP